MSQRAAEREKEIKRERKIEREKERERQFDHFFCLSVRLAGGGELNFN